MFSIEVLLLIVIIGFLLYKWSVAKYGVFKERGIPHDKPKPIIGTIEGNVFLGKTSLLRSLINKHQKYKNCKIYGVFNMRDPAIMIRDLDLIRKIGIKDFDTFPNHQKPNDALKNELFSKGLLSLQDRKWKEMRSVLSPSFTGSKMRLMFELINECCAESIKYIEKEMKASANNELELEIKDFFTRFTNDVIASVAFGIKVNSFENKNNEFHKIGREITQFKGWTLIKVALFGLIPKVMKALGFKIMDGNKTNYFNVLVLDAMKYRQENNIIRPDMIHLLTEAKRHHEETRATENSELSKLEDDDLVAQCFLFFLAGFDTVSNCLTFTTHELAINADKQELLYQEILETEKELNGAPLNYDALVKMKYMDMVLSESLRLWPPVVMTDRVCATDYDLKDDDGNLIAQFKKGDSIMLPIVGLHRDPENFPNPELFDPERFSEERKHEIKPHSYLPFGIGPRACIGNRLALMETKSIIYHMLLKFKMVPAKKTAMNMLEELKGFQLQPPDLFWVKFLPRDN